MKCRFKKLLILCIMGILCCFTAVSVSADDTTDPVVEVIAKDYGEVTVGEVVTVQIRITDESELYSAGTICLSCWGKGIGKEILYVDLEYRENDIYEAKFEITEQMQIGEWYMNFYYLIEDIWGNVSENKYSYLDSPIKFIVVNNDFDPIPPRVYSVNLLVNDRIANSGTMVTIGDIVKFQMDIEEKSGLSSKRYIEISRKNSPSFDNLYINYNDITKKYETEEIVVTKNTKEDVYYISGYFIVDNKNNILIKDFSVETSPIKYIVDNTNNDSNEDNSSTDKDKPLEDGSSDDKENTSEGNNTENKEDNDNTGIADDKNNDTSDKDKDDDNKNDNNSNSLNDKNDTNTSSGNHASSNRPVSSGSSSSSSNNKTMAEMHVSGREEFEAQFKDSYKYSEENGYYYSDAYYNSSAYYGQMKKYREMYTEPYATNFDSLADYAVTGLEMSSWKLPNNVGRMAYNYTRGIVSSEKGILTTTAFPFPSKWCQVNGQWMFQCTDGTYPKGQTVFNANGLAATVYDWEFIDGKWYPFNEYSWLETGWVYDEAEQAWFYVDKIRGALSGWQEINKKWYYFEPVSNGSKGRMLTNTWIGNYYVDGNGVWVQ